MTWRTLVVNMGNMTADSDSICGSICLAYYHFMKENGIEKINVEDATVYHIPLLNISRSKFEAKLETHYILDTYEVNKEFILTLDDVDLKEVMKHANAHIVLYDHNVPEVH